MARPLFVFDYDPTLPDQKYVSMDETGPLVGYPPEPDADGHWLFGGDAGCLVSLTGAGVALVVNEVAPTYHDGWMVIAPKPNGLIVPEWADEAILTMMAVVNRPTNTEGHSALIFSPTDNHNLRGASLRWRASSTDTPSALVSKTAGSDVEGVVLPGPVDVGEWCIVGLSQSATTRITFMAGVGYVADAIAKTAHPTARLGLGNRYDSGAAFDLEGLSAAEWIVWRGVAKTVSDMESIAVRSAARVAARGVALAAG